MTVTPEPGDFAVCRMGGAGGRLVSLGERLCGDAFTQYGHAFLYAGGGQVVEAEPGGAREVPLSAARYGDTLWSTGHIALCATQRAAICLAARSYVGTPYSWLDYVAIAAHRLHLPLPGLRSYIKSTRHEMCSALVDRVYQEAGVQLFDDKRWNGYVTPADLAAVIEHAKTAATA